MTEKEKKLVSEMTDKEKEKEKRSLRIAMARYRLGGGYALVIRTWMFFAFCIFCFVAGMIAGSGF